MGTDSKRAFLAVVLSGVVLFGWQFFFAPKEANIQQKSSVDNVQTVQVKERKIEIVEPDQVIEAGVKKNIEEHSITLKKNGHVVNINNKLSVLDFVNPSSKFSYQETVEEARTFRIQIITSGKAEEINFDLKKTGDNSVTGNNSKYGIVVNGMLHDNGKLNLKLRSTKGYIYRFVFKSKEKELQNRQLRQFIVLGKEDVERTDFGDEYNEEGSVKWAAIDFNYHIFGVIFKNSFIARSSLTKDGLGTIHMVNPVSEMMFDLVFTKKTYTELSSIGENLELSVDFGIFGILAVPILKGLLYSYSVIPNYGIAIIILTLVMRLLTFPLQYKSFKSMKKMQKVQPELKKIKEKYKDDPKRVQQETMALFKKAGANPLGGCFPLLLQMPVFFAFYRVLYNSVELVGSPFFGWLSDLSQKDPYYILPVLMAVTMLVQQKFQPSPSADPAQKKIMMIMPLVFGFIMKDLPSGLCLYIFVSTLFGIVQQLFVYKTTD